MVISPVDGARAPARLSVARLLRSFWPRPRARRLADGARLLLSAAGLLALVLLAVLDTGLVAVAPGVVPPVARGLPRAALSVVNVLASTAVLVALLVLAVDALRHRRFVITSALLSCLLGLAGGFAVAVLAHASGDAAARTLLGPPHQAAGLPVTAAVALLVGADLHRRRWVGRAWLALAVAIGCALALGTLAVPSALFAVLVGTTAGLGVRVAVGVLPARPPDELVLALLAGAGWQLRALRPLGEAAGRIRYAAIGPDDADLRVTVVDPDRRGILFPGRLWRMLRLRTAAVGRPPLTLRGQLERQALSAALARAAGVAAPRVMALLAAGPSLLLVEQPVGGAPLPDAGPSDAGRGVGAALRALRRLHDVGLAHGALTEDDVVLLPDGGAGFADLSSAQPAASDLQRELDVVALLVAAGRHVGAATAVALLRADYGSTRAAEARLAALLQPLALPRPARGMVRGTTLLDDLRTALRPPGGRGSTAAVRIERLRPRTVLSVAGGTLAAHILITQLSSVGLGAALGSARPGWLAVALVGSAVTYLGAALALQAFATVRLPLPRTALVQVASSFLTLVTPPTVGHVGLNIRYLQRAGVPTATATGSVAVKETVTVAVTVPVLLVCGWLSGVSASRLALLPSGTVLTVLAVAAAVLAAAVAAPPTRRLLRHRLEPLVRRTLPQLLATAGNPRRLATAVAGVLVLNAGYVLALDASLRAFSTSVAVPTLVVVYLAASALGSAAPTPGGLGAVEAALVGGLTATGVPFAAALTAVLAFRTATFWLPAPFGWLAFVALQRRRRI